MLQNPEKNPAEETSESPDPRKVYSDIIDLPHHQSAVRPHMSLYDRSAQFASYKALAGYEDMVAEEARLTDRFIEQDEYELDILGKKLDLIDEAVRRGARPEITFTVFVPDDKKAGGKYVQMTDKVKRIDQAQRKIVLESTEGRANLNRTIDFDMLVSLEGELLTHV